MTIISSNILSIKNAFHLLEHMMRGRRHSGGFNRFLVLRYKQALTKGKELLSTAGMAVHQICFKRDCVDMATFSF